MASSRCTRPSRFSGALEVEVFLTVVVGLAGVDVVEGARAEYGSTSWALGVSAPPAQAARNTTSRTAGTGRSTAGV